MIRRLKPKELLFGKVAGQVYQTPGISRNEDHIGLSGGKAFGSEEPDFTVWYQIARDNTDAFRVHIDQAEIRIFFPWHPSRKNIVEHKARQVTMHSSRGFDVAIQLFAGCLRKRGTLTLCRHDLTSRKRENTIGTLSFYGTPFCAQRTRFQPFSLILEVKNSASVREHPSAETEENCPWIIHLRYTIEQLTS